MTFRSALGLSLSLLLAAPALAQLDPALADAYIIDQDNAVVDGLVTDKLLVILANDVTLNNVTANRLWHQRPYTGLTVTNSTFIGTDPTDNTGAVVQPDTLLDNVTIDGHKDGLYIETGGSVTVRDSFIDIRSDEPDNHADGITLPFAQNFNGEADFLIESTTVWAEGKTAAFNQQALPITVLDSTWSGSVYAAPGSVYQGQAQNPDDVRLGGRVVPWEVPLEDFQAVVSYNVQELGSVLEALPGDFIGDGRVNQADIDWLLNNWGQTAATSSVNGTPADLSLGQVDQAELDRLLDGWGSIAAPNFTTASFAGIPEPALGTLLLALPLAWTTRRRARLHARLAEAQR